MARRTAFPRPAIEWAPRTYAAPYLSAGIVVDGRLDPQEWEDAPETAPFVDIVGGEAPRPRFATRARIAWDDTYLYVGARLEEPHVWGTHTERDAIIFEDNDFELFVDPDGDTHTYYELEINARGTEWDLFLVRPYRDGGPALHAWDIPGLLTAVAVDGTLDDPSDVDRAWSVEIAMPWAVLKEAAGRAAPPAPGDQWRINFSRVEWRHDVVDGRYRRTPDAAGEPLPADNWVWSPQGLVAMHYPEMWGIVEFRKGAQGSTVGVVPDPAWRAAWDLRQIYYAERDRHDHPSFTSTATLPDGRVLRIDGTGRVSGIAE